MTLNALVPNAPSNVVQVTVTELPGKTGLLGENVAFCLAPEGRCEVKECVWGEPGKDTPWGPVTDMGEDWDYVVGSDLIYSDESTPALVRSPPSQGK